MGTWNNNPREILDFENLQRMEFCNCSSLKYIFTPSMALSLKRLYSLKIKECGSLEQVMFEEEVVDHEEAMTDKFTIFHQLSSIQMESCSNLTCFYLGSRALEFRNLKTIRIAECPKMSTFASRNKEKEWIGKGSEIKLGQGVLNIAPTFFSDKVSLLCFIEVFIYLSFSFWANKNYLKSLKILFGLIGFGYYMNFIHFVN